MVKWFTCILFIFSTQPVHAWNIDDFKEEASAPVTTDAKYIFWTGSALTLGVLLFEDKIVDPTQNEFKEKPLGSLTKVGDLAGQMIPNVLYCAGEWIAGSNGDPNGKRRALGMFKASAYAASTTTILKYTIREPRPNGNARNSFPSGHATTAFAFAGYIFEEHGFYAGLPAIGLATLVAASRINDNMHYLHDVLFGATIGLSYGMGISSLDKNQIHFFPIVDGKTKGISFYSDF